MSDLDPRLMRRDLLLEAELTRALDPLVQRANQTAALLKGKEKMEESQLRNLLNVAVESRSPEVVVNFIRYQIGRSGSAWGLGRDEFGHRVIADLTGEVRGLAEQASRAVLKAMPDAPDAERLGGEAYVRLIQLYLGYLSRAFYYAKKTGEFDRLKEVAGGV